MIKNKKFKDIKEVIFPYNFTNEYNNNDYILGTHFDSNFSALSTSIDELNNKLDILKSLTVTSTTASYTFDTNGDLIISTPNFLSRGEQIVLFNGLEISLMMTETIPCKKGIKINIDNTGFKSLYIDTPTISIQDIQYANVNLRGALVTGENIFEFNSILNGWFYKPTHLTGQIVTDMYDTTTYANGYLRLDGTNNGWENMHEDDILPIVNFIDPATKLTINTADATPVQVGYESGSVTPEKGVVYEGINNTNSDVTSSSFSTRMLDKETSGSHNSTQIIHDATGDFTITNLSNSSVGGDEVTESYNVDVNKLNLEHSEAGGTNLSERFATVYYLKL